MAENLLAYTVGESVIYAVTAVRILNGVAGPLTGDSRIGLAHRPRASAPRIGLRSRG